MRRIIEEIVKGMMLPNITAKVLAVDKENNTCDVAPINGAAQILGCSLRVDDGKTKGKIIYPTIGSLVMVAPIDGMRAHYLVMMYSEVDEVVCEINNTKMAADKEGVLIAKGNDGLKEILNEIANQMLKIYAPKDVPGITKLKTRINNLLKDA